MLRQPAHRVARPPPRPAPARAPAPGSGPPAPAAVPPPGAASARTARSEAAAATIAGMFSKPGRTPRLPLVQRGLGARTAPPCVRRAARPPTGPPHLWALAVSSDQPPSTGPQASDCAASTSSGTPAVAAHRGDLGHRLLVSPPRGWPTAGRPARCPGRRAAAYASGATAPVRSTATSVTVPPSASCTSAACSTEECSTADTTRWRPARRRPASAPAIPECTARVPEEVKTSSSGRHPTASAAASRAASSSSRARRPSRYSRAGSAHPSSSEASRACRATGCRGAAEAASK